MKQYDENIQLGETELLLRDIGENNSKKKFYYDYVSEGRKKIIEFNGDFSHCNPSKWKAEQINPTLKKTAKEIWDKDQRKIDVAKKNGYDVLIVWENEYALDKDATLKKCVEFLCS